MKDSKMEMKKGKRGLVSQESITERTIEYRQRMLDVFNKEGGATFSDMHFKIEPNSERQKLQYHFMALKNNGYIKPVGSVKPIGAAFKAVLWQAVKFKYEHVTPTQKEKLIASLVRKQEKKEEKEKAAIVQKETSFQVDGVTIRRIFECHTKANPIKSKKSYPSGATLGYAI